MLITDKKELNKYKSEKRLWQGIPSIAITEKGKIFVCFYSGEDRETNGNYSLLFESSDGGKTFSNLVAVAFEGKDARAFDSVLWYADKKLYYFWSVMPEMKVKFAVCDNPDSDNLSWSEVKTLGEEVMLNKPIITSKGEWLFPVAVWADELIKDFGISPSGRNTGAYVYKSTDEGETFEKSGSAVITDRGYDEHMLIEKSDGKIELYARTKYGVGKSVSLDGAKTFVGDEKAFDGPDSRFFIRRLPSGNILLVNHVNFSGRNNLTALISFDDGKTFVGGLLLDERNEVSYPDGDFYDGYIYVVYDRERGAKYQKDKDYSYSAREILLAKFTEEDIIKGEISSGGYLKHIVNKL